MVTEGEGLVNPLLFEQQVAALDAERAQLLEETARILNERHEILTSATEWLRAGNERLLEKQKTPPTE